MCKGSIPLALVGVIVLIAVAFSDGIPKVAAAGTSPAATGQKIYSENCSACHGANGAGMPGMFPPLVGNPMVTGPPAKVIAAVKNGLTGATTVNGKTYNGSMPAWKGKLSDTQMADVITYIRSSWGNSAGAVTEAQVTGAK